MIDYSEALVKTIEVATQHELQIEALPISEIVGRSLAKDVRSREDIPSFDNSAMDGFALCSTETLGSTSESPRKFKVVGTVAAGDRSLRPTAKDNCVEIMTGAMMPPPPFDSVVRIEDVRVFRNAKGDIEAIQLDRSIAAGENTRKKAEDFRAGQVIARRGDLLGPEHIMAFAATGVPTVEVYLRPRVALLQTGKELVNGETATLVEGQIRDSNGPLLAAALKLMSCELIYQKTIPDEAAEFQQCLLTILKDAPDFILTTGAVSMGKFDFIKPVLLDMGARIHFHKVAIRPGKPILFAELKSSSGAWVPFFGLPGNPVSTLVGLRFFVGPYVRRLRKQSDEASFYLPLAQNVKKPEGLKTFYKARRINSEAGTKIECLKGQASFMISPLLESDGWAVMSESGGQVESGQSVAFYPLYDTEKGSSL